MNNFKNVLKVINYLIIPRRCGFCGKLIPMTSGVCSDCEKLLPEFGKVCSGCGNNKDKCDCNLKNHIYDNCLTAFIYDGKLAKSYRRFKFAGDRYRGRIFAEYMAKVLRENFPVSDIDVVCSVPGSHAKRKNGGYVPADILAGLVSKEVGLKYDKRILRKVKKNKTQHTLSLYDRRVNVHNVYRAVGDVMNKKVLLIDDIRTTGATLDECAKELKFSGAAYVVVLTAFHTQSNKN